MISNSSDSWALLFPVLWGSLFFILSLATQIAIFWIAMPAFKARTVIRCGWVFLLFLESTLFGFASNYSEILIATLVYLFLFLGYLEFYFTVDRSITTRMLILIQQRGEMTTKDMKIEYPPDFLLERRFQDLVIGKFLACDNGRYRVTPKGRWVARLYKFFVTALRLGKEHNPPGTPGPETSGLQFEPAS